MQKLSFTNSLGVTVNLTTSPFGVTEWAGFANVDMEIQSQTVPFVDGSVYIDNLLSDRELTVTLAIEDNNNLKKRYELRRELIKVLNPKLGEGSLIYQNNYLKKKITCIPSTPIFETHNSDTTGTPKAQLSFTACQPYWEDIESTIVNFSLTEQPTVVNDGDVATQVKLRLSGQCTNPRITNITTGSQIGLSGLVSEPIEINTEFGKKSVIGSELGWTNIFGGYLNGIANKGEGVVVVGTDGAILYSSNGLKWFSQISDTVENLNGVTANYSFNLYIACGNNGTFVYSTDGKDWSLGICSSTENFNSIACSDSRAVAVGDNGVIVTSTDGMSFGATTSPTSENLHSVVYTGSRFIAVGDNGTVITSTDGLTWAAVIIDTTENLNGINVNTATNDIIIVGDNGTVKMSDSLMAAWITIEIDTTENLNSVCYNNYLTKYLICGDNGTFIAGYGTEWGIQSINNDVNLNAVYFSSDLGLNFISGQGFLTRSANDSDWTTCLSIADTQLYDIIYIAEKGLYIASGTNGYIFVSENAENWEVINIGIDVDIYVLAYNSNVIVGVGTNGTTIISYNGRTWIKVVDGTLPIDYFLMVDSNTYLVTENDDRIITYTNEMAGTLYGMCYSTKTNSFIAVGDTGEITSSTNGTIWTKQSKVTENTLRDIVNGDIFVAVGDNNTIVISENGIDWTLVETGFDVEVNFKAVTSSPTRTKYVAVGDNGYIATSKDGTKWDLYRIALQTNLNAVCYSQAYSQFLAVGDNGVIVRSVDGKVWLTSTSGTTQNYESVIYMQEIAKYIAVGNKGTIMTSYTASSTNMINSLSPNSDVNFNLAIGENILRLSCENGNPYASIEFKNKYIGV